MPSAVQGLRLAEGYEVFDASLKAANQPYSATGDFDGDGDSNLTEYNAIVIDGGGTVDDFVVAASDPLNLPGEGEGEGEEPVGCFGASQSGTSSKAAMGDLLLILAASLAIAGFRRRKCFG
jgi:hypothetical protein